MTTAEPITVPHHPTSPALVPPAYAAVSGAVGAAVALGSSELIAGVLPGAVSLVASVGQTVIDLQPPGAKDLVVALFGTNDKLAFQLLIVGVALVFGAILGIVARRSYPAAAIGFAAFGLLGFLAALGDPLAQPVMVAATAFVAVALGLETLSWLLGRAPLENGSGAAEAIAARDASRRGFLVGSGTIGLAAIGAGWAGRWLIERQLVAPAGNAEPVPPPGEIVAPLAPGTDLATTVDGLTPIVMPNDRFYRIDTALLVPVVDAATWSLRIHGLVERETTLTWSELIGLPLFEQYVTIACVSNEVGGDLVGNAKWTGVRLREVLDLAGVLPSATQLVGRSVDGWTAGMPTAWVMDPQREPMIAVLMNDEPLPPRHGYPARLIVPGLFGYVSATKWLSDLELTTLEGFDGFWIPRGWAKEAPILTQSRIDTPTASSQHPAGTLPVAGIAWAPDRGVSRVEVEVDGTWRDARLSAPISDTTWVQWLVDWDATAGDHQIRVRATDGAGATQPEQRSPPAPDGARGWHTISVHID